MHFFQLARGNLGDVGHKVVGDAVRVLADEAGLVRADGVEVAQDGDVEARVGLEHIAQNALRHDLGGAVGVRGLVQRGILGQGHGIGIAVYGGR